MSVWISDEKVLIFASLISPSKMILFEKKYQTFDTVFHHQMKHLEVRQKYSAFRVVFSTILSVFHLVMKHCVSCLIYYINNIQFTFIFCGGDRWTARYLSIILSRVFHTTTGLCSSSAR